MAKAFASRGVKVGLAARRTEPLSALKQTYPEFIEFESIDINREDAPSRLYSLIDRLGGMDIYVHIAGIGYDNPALDPEREVNMIATNAGGFARMTCAAYRYFRSEKRKGSIVAVTSVAGTNGIGQFSAYSASKKCAQTYLVALRQLAHAEKVDVSFTDIRPGWIRTPLLRSDTHYLMEMDIDHVLPLIIKAIVHRPRVAYIDSRWLAIVEVWKRIPDFIWTRMNLTFSHSKPSNSTDRLRST